MRTPHAVQGRMGQSEAKLVPPSPQCAETNLVRHRAPRRSVDDLAFAARGQLFSRSGNLSDPNIVIDPDFLAALTSIGVNKKAYKPTFAESKDTATSRCTSRRKPRR